MRAVWEDGIPPLPNALMRFSFLVSTLLNAASKLKEEHHMTMA